MPEPFSYIGIVIVAVAVAWVVGRSLIVWWKRRRKPEVSDSDFAGLFGDKSAAAAVRVRRVLESSLADVAARVGPDDDLFDAWALGDNADLRFTSFIMDLETEFGVAIPDDVAGELRTLRRVVIYLDAETGN